MKKLKEYDRPIMAATAHTAAWAAASYGIFFYSTELTAALIPFIVGFLFVYPVGTFYTAFRYSKRYGIKWYFIAVIALLTAIAYFLLGFDSVEPNFIVMTVLAVFFGCGLGKLSYNDVRPKKKEKRT